MKCIHDCCQPSHVGSAAFLGNSELGHRALTFLSILGDRVAKGRVGHTLNHLEDRVVSHQWQDTQPKYSTYALIVSLNPSPALEALGSYHWDLCINTKGHRGHRVQMTQVTVTLRGENRSPA